MKQNALENLVKQLERRTDTFEGEISVNALTDVTPFEWVEESTEKGVNAFKVREPAEPRRVPATVVNILQVAEYNPEAVNRELQDLREQTGWYSQSMLMDIEMGTDEWLKELADCLGKYTLKNKRYDKYPERYWFRGWDWIRRRNDHIEGMDRIRIKWQEIPYRQQRKELREMQAKCLHEDARSGEDVNW